VAADEPAAVGEIARGDVAHYHARGQEDIVGAILPLHEAGQALYEQAWRRRLDGTPLGAVHLQVSLKAGKP